MSNRGPSIVMGGIQWGPNRYPTLWVWEPYGKKRNGKYGEYWAFPIHRLVAYAHGKLDHIRFEKDAREVDHLNGDKWDNRIENLDPKTPEEHCRKTHNHAT